MGFSLRSNRSRSSDDLPTCPSWQTGWCHAGRRCSQHSPRGRESLALRIWATPAHKNRIRGLNMVFICFIYLMWLSWDTMGYTVHINFFVFDVNGDCSKNSDCTNQKRRIEPIFKYGAIYEPKPSVPRHSKHRFKWFKRLKTNRNGDGTGFPTLLC